MALTTVEAIQKANLADTTHLSSFGTGDDAVAGLTSEQIDDIKKYIDGFAKKEQYFAKYVQHAKWNKGSKVMQFRRYVANEVKYEDIKPIVEEVAPRATNVTIKTYTRKIERYGGKWKYTREDTLYGYDNIVAIGGDVLRDEVTQTLDLLTGYPFFHGRATETLASGTTPILSTLETIAVRFMRQNHCKPYLNGKYLAMVTPEVMMKIRAEIASKSTALSEATKVELDNGIVGSYGRWLFSECPSDLAVTGSGSSQKHYVVCMARSKDGTLPVVMSEYGGVEIYDNPLGSGLLKDVNGNLTSDDNKQMGSIAWNIDGLTSDVNDDLALIRFEVSAQELLFPIKNDYTARSDNSEASNYVKGSTSPKSAS